MSAATALQHSGFFVLRAPLLPFDGATGGGRERLRLLLDRADVREAVFVASPSLEAQVDAWRRDPDSEAGRKAEQALARYAARATGRATPFGLFAGCAVGAIGRATRLSVGGPCRRHTRLDMDYVVLLADALQRDPALRPHLRFTPNSSLYRVAGRARYREVRRQDKGWTQHRAVLSLPDYLEAVLARAAGGATPAELARVLLDGDPEATEAEAAEYVADLIGQQVLVSELVPAVTGPEPVHGLIGQLRRIPAGARAADVLSWVRDELAAMDGGGLGTPPARYRGVAERLGELPAPVDPARLFQVDLVRPAAGAMLGENVLAEIAKGVELLRRLVRPPVEDALTEFRRAFAARFGDTTATREVPLAEALDDETGVGFGQDEAVEASSLLDGLDLASPSESRIAWGPREAHLLERLTETLSRGVPELALTERDVERLAAADPPPLPDAFAAMARLEAASDEAVARGDFRLLLTGASGPSGARLLGRFCHADPDLAEGVLRHLRAEEALRPDAVFAEIVHLPEGRVGNILARPACRGHEIPYLGRSGLPADRQVPLSDLLVSVQGSRVVLRSARLGREVLPRLTNAHNFSACDGVYRFLCALQGQGAATALAWDWGPLAGAAFLPRVVHGRLVLARAQWRVTKEEASRLLASPDGRRRWREERRLPRWVCLVESDNELPVDLDDDFMAGTLLGRLHAREQATLAELFPAPDRLCASGPDGRYVHELVVPFVRRAPAEAPRERAPLPRASPAVRRTFPPGSEWLALKVYAGSLVVDHLVGEALGPLAEELVAEGRAASWFFVRYADPHGHLRLRLRGDPERLRDDVLPALQAAVSPLLEDGRIWKVQVDTYERELERYGGPSGIGPCEEIFHEDSRAVVGLLRLPDDDGRGDRRWRLALLGMDRLLDDLGLDLEAKHRVLGRARDAFRAEFRAGAEALARIGAKYRAESPALGDLLAGGGEDWAAERAVLESRSLAVAPAAAALRRVAPAIAPSLLHMHANRLLRSAHRAHELVLYEFLHRHCEGLLARRRDAPRRMRPEPV